MVSKRFDIFSLRPWEAWIKERSNFRLWPTIFMSDTFGELAQILERRGSPVQLPEISHINPP